MRRRQLPHDPFWIDGAASRPELSASVKVERRREEKLKNEAAYYIVSNPDVSAAGVNDLISLSLGYP